MAGLNRNARQIKSGIGGRFAPDFPIQAVPCGIIVNELITNAQKHGFEGMDTGKILIMLKNIDDGFIALSVEDNGKGLPEDFSMENAGSLGLSLVNILARQIDGELTVDSSNGTSMSIRFPKV
ncbi:MAG: ATP-binding protein [Spirochaetia bacterium]|nr:ATP-binding protein [Spirochaetia bacterium]